MVHQAQEVRLRMGAALQEAALDVRQTGRELLELQARLYGLRRDERRRRVAEVLDLVNIGAAVDRRTLDEVFRHVVHGEPSPAAVR